MDNRKNIRIKSKFRFITFLIIVLIASITCISTVAGFYNVSGETEQKYTEVQVMSGETLWNIASRYNNDGKDTRQVVYEIRQANDLASSELTAGETIKVPIQ